jgi:hypothetical protein
MWLMLEFEPLRLSTQSVISLSLKLKQELNALLNSSFVFGPQELCDGYVEYRGKSVVRVCG